MGKMTTKRLCLVAVFAALYFVLTMYLTIRIGNITITLASLPILILAVLYGPLESTVAAALGEFIHQLLSWGLTLTTPLWLLPPVVRGLIVAFGCMLIRRRCKVKEPWEQPAAFFALLVAAAVVTTLANTGITWLDSVIFGYYSKAYVFGDFVIRLFTGIGTAVVLGFVIPPVVKALKRAGM
ncbi:MAG: folate family ECF transporter S component [Clostridia bacterium]|nr:folate family ECF transporter S component [Clostridia bacterium]